MRCAVLRSGMCVTNVHRYMFDGHSPGRKVCRVVNAKVKDSQSAGRVCVTQYGKHFFVCLVYGWEKNWKLPLMDKAKSCALFCEKP